MNCNEAISSVYEWHISARTCVVVGLLLLPRESGSMVVGVCTGTVQQYTGIDLSLWE